VGTQRKEKEKNPLNLRFNMCKLGMAMSPSEKIQFYKKKHGLAHNCTTFLPVAFLLLSRITYSPLPPKGGNPDSSETLFSSLNVTTSWGLWARLFFAKHHTTC
jgi:hypothetical protein